MTAHDPVKAEQAKKAFYVDDCLLSVPSPEEVRRISQTLRQILSSSGFNLTKFFSNVPHTLGDLPRAETKMLYLDQQPVDLKRTLGVEWECKSDCIIFNVTSWEGKLTRRSVLAYVASLYDPLGLVAPSLLPVKRFLQDLCRRGAKWDEEVTKEEAFRWETCYREMQAIRKIRIPRCILAERGEGGHRTELHAFSDASEVGFGAVVYLRFINDNGRAKCALVLAKSRGAPLKSITIPRLELAAAVVSAKLVAFAKDELSLPIDSVTFWTDSQIVIQLIRNTKTRFETCVQSSISNS
ncbi:WDFY family member 4 [Fasciola gigantica]|uniref:WDFY family member 4 n=1 Tax=Fasciola gigantica TaxID=46835 RepID=A0A504Z2N7_FASGI|nr:WDFY family member 4 [Fasciola gigantica]